MNLIHLFHDWDTKNSTISKILMLTDDEVNEKRDEYQKALEYYDRERKDWLKTQDFRADFEDVDVDEYRIRQLRHEYKEAQDSFNELCREYAEMLKLEPKMTHYWHIICIQQEEANMKKILREVRMLQGKKEDFDEYTIAKAREYPISDIVKVNKAGMASCPFHEDKKPSMDTRKNFFHCYSCGESGDVIALVMKMEHLNFIQAINRLS